MFLSGFQDVYETSECMLHIQWCLLSRVLCPVRYYFINLLFLILEGKLQESHPPIIRGGWDILEYPTVGGAWRKSQNHVGVPYIGGGGFFGVGVRIL